MDNSSMHPDRWRKVENIYHSALDRPPAQRATFVAEICSGDADLQREVESLLREEANGSGMLDSPVWDVVRDVSKQLSPGTQLGPYRIADSLGAGGMGEVYRATDTRLGRTVAVKVLHGPHSDRFQREARAISALNHPNICTLHDIGEDSGTPYLVMEHVEGETLSARLRKGPLPIATAVQYGSQIAGALAAAHARGIIHRDLKPSNVMITSSGVKLLDFGLARILKPPSPSDATSVETRTVTAKGVVAGTVPYMAPEQIEGLDCDARTDIFALGLLLYEMVAGRRAFADDSQARLMAAILKDEPPPLALSPAPPARFEELLRTCIAKNPSERWQSALDVQRALAWVTGDPPVLAKRTRRPWLAAAGVVAAVLTFAAAALWWNRPEPAAELPLGRFLLPPPENTRHRSLPTTSPVLPIVSPDGKQIAFMAARAGEQSSVWVRPLDSLTARRLEATEEGRSLFWSPDGRFLAFFVRQKLMKVDVSGGMPELICDVPLTTGSGSWGTDGAIVFSSAEGLHRVSSAGGAPELFIRVDTAAGEINLAWPQLLPDGKHLLYLARHKESAKSAVYVQRLGSPDRHRLISSQFKAVFTLPDHLLFVRSGSTLLHQFVDLSAYRVRGEPVPIAENIPTNQIPFNNVAGAAGYTASNNGVLVYASRAYIPRRLVMRDRSGKQLSVLGEPGLYGHLVVSPDERQVALILNNPATRADLWVMELSTGILSRLTADTPAIEAGPIWTPDSRRILVYNENRDITVGCDIQEITVASRASRGIYSDPDLPCWLGDLSADGRFAVYHSGREVSLLPLTGEPKPQRVTESAYQIDEFHFSPDGKWLAFSSNETRRHEIYIASLPSFAEKRQISIEGGVQPVWQKDGKGLYFLSLTGVMMYAEVQTAPVVVSGVPKPLFQSPHPNPDYRTTFYQVLDGGRKFLFAENEREEPVRPLTVVFNWTAGLKR